MAFKYNPITNQLDIVGSSTGPGSGTVTSVSVVTANGLAGTVANPTTTPAITLSTTATGVLSGNGTTISGSPVTQHSVLAGGISNAITSIAVGTTGQVLTGVTGGDPVWASPATSGTVTSVSGTANQVAVATGTTTPVISLVGPYTPSTYLAHGVLLGEGTSSIVATAVGSTGQVLTGVTASDPVWASPAASSISITGNTGGALTGAAFTFSGGTTGLSFGGSGSTETLSGVVVLANGGTNANLTASNGGIFYSTATAGAILSGTATAHQLLLSGASTTPLWSTSTYPTTNAINTLLYASSANVMAALATANSGVLTTSSGGVPSIDTTNFAVLSTGVQMKANNAATAPPTGFIGEVILATTTIVSPVSLTTLTPKTVTSISLTAGNWNISGFGQFNNNTVGSNQIVLSISTADNTLGPNDGYSYSNWAGNVVASGAILPSTISPVIPCVRVSLSSTTIYYLVGYSEFSTGTSTVGGTIIATRVG